jgi:hypothetical protein
LGRNRRYPVRKIEKKVALVSREMTMPILLLSGNAAQVPADGLVERDGD